jgi:hypothetical protein
MLGLFGVSMISCVGGGIYSDWNKIFGENVRGKNALSRLLRRN